MPPRRRVPRGNTVGFFDATPIGLMSAKDPDEFIDSSPEDFLDALKRANDETARTGNLFRAIRVPVPKTLYNAPDSVVHEAAMRLIFEAVKIGQVEGTFDGPLGTLIYIIQPTVFGITRETFAKTIKTTFSEKSFPAKRTTTGRGARALHSQVGSVLPSSRGLLDATRNGLVEAKNPRKYLEEAPAGFLEAYQKAEREAPGKMFVIRTPCFPGMTKEQEREATIDAAWRAYQKSGGFAPKEAAAAEKTDQKKEKRAAGGGGIAGTCDLPEKEEKVIGGLESLPLGAEKTDQKKDKKASEVAGIADTHDSQVAVGGKSAVRRKKTAARGRGTPLPILRQGDATLPSSTDIL